MPDAPRMLARAANFTVIDFETTGAAGGHPDEPWQLAMLTLDGRGLDGARAFESLLRVGPRPFHPMAPGRWRERRHGLQTAPTLASLWPSLAPGLTGRPLVAHNVGTERKFLRALAPLHRLGPWVDTLKLSRIAHPGLPSYALEDLTGSLGLEASVRERCPGRAAHDALYDAWACAALLDHLLGLPGWEGVTVAALARPRRL